MFKTSTQLKVMLSNLELFHPLKNSTESCETINRILISKQKQFRSAKVFKGKNTENIKSRSPNSKRLNFCGSVPHDEKFTVAIFRCSGEYLRRPSSCRPTDCLVCSQTTWSDFIYCSRIPTAPLVDPFKSYPLMVQSEPLCKKVSIRHTHPRDAESLDWPSTAIHCETLPLGKHIVGFFAPLFFLKQNCYFVEFFSLLPFIDSLFHQTIQFHEESIRFFAFLGYGYSGYVF